MSTRKTSLKARLFIGVVLASTSAKAWLIHEHVRITAAGMESLGNATELQILWDNVHDLAGLLCADVSTGDRAYESNEDRSVCVGLEGLTALAGDHSCSVEDLSSMLDPQALKARWVSRVLLESDNMRRKVDEVFTAGDGDGAKRRELLRGHDIELQLIDPEYLTRAKNTLGHFQLPREPGDSLDEYLKRATSPMPPAGTAKTQQPNALGFYIAFHGAALRTLVDALRGCVLGATKIAACDNTQVWNNRRRQFLKAILAESLAIHFLEDTFPSGHIVGATGNLATRKGTHDYYGHHGTSAQPWCGLVGDRDLAPASPQACRDYVAFGEGFLDGRDVAHARVAAAESLKEFMLAARRPLDPRVTAWTNLAIDDSSLRKLDSCNADGVPLEAGQLVTAARHTAQFVPQAGLRGSGAPRFQVPLGWFWAPNMEVAARLSLGGPREQTYRVDVPSRLQVGIDVGVLADGLVSGRADGVISLGPLIAAAQNPVYGTWSVGWGGRLQLPFTYFPGDIFVIWPYLLAYQLIAGEATFMHWALRAADGGVARLEQRIPLGRGWTFQLVAGRRVAVMTHLNESRRGLENATLNGKPGVLQLQFPLAVLSTSHITDGVLGYDAEWILGYDVSWVRHRAGGESRGYFEPVHGLYLSYASKARRQKFF